MREYFVVCANRITCPCYLLTTNKASEDSALDRNPVYYTVVSMLFSIIPIEPQYKPYIIPDSMAFSIFFLNPM